MISFAIGGAVSASAARPYTWSFTRYAALDLRTYV